MQWWIQHSSDKSSTSSVINKRNYKCVFMASKRRVYRGTISDGSRSAGLGLKLVTRCPIVHGSLPWVQWGVWSSQSKEPTDKRSKVTRKPHFLFSCKLEQVIAIPPVLGVHWKDWCWSWHSNTLATWFRELTHWKRPWCWGRLKARGESEDRGWDGWMASPTKWTWVWVNSRSWWWTGRPGVLQSMGLQRVGHDWSTELNCPVFLAPLFEEIVFSPLYILASLS